MRYRRALIKGATYFFTVNRAERWSRLLVDGVMIKADVGFWVKRSGLTDQIV
jgi:hypothetical protein